MIDREYYPLHMATKMLRCDTDDLVYLAANGKLIIHLLTDGDSYTTYYYDEEEGFSIDYRLPKFSPVLQLYWQRLEAGNDTGVLVDVTDCWNEPSEHGNLRASATSISNNKPNFVILRKEVEKLTKKSTKTDISETERNTMLKLIIGMAMDAYKYDPDEPRNNATGGSRISIKSALEKYGLSADQKTISKYLNEAAELYPDARPRKP